MGDALSQPEVPLLAAEIRSRRPVSFRRYRPEVARRRRWLLAIGIAFLLASGFVALEVRYLAYYWQAKSGIQAGRAEAAWTAFQTANRWWAPWKPAGAAGIREFFERRDAFLHYTTTMAPYHQSRQALEGRWQGLRQQMMRGKASDEEVLGKLEEIVRGLHQVVLDLPEPHRLLHAKDAAVHTHLVEALQMKEQGLTQLWYAFHLHDPTKVSVANQLMARSREAQARYDEGLSGLKTQFEFR